MSASDAGPLPRLGETFFDARGSSRSMRLSWYSNTGVAVFSIWQGGTCTGTFRLPTDDLSRLVDSLRRGVPGSQANEDTGPIALSQRPQLALGAASAEPFTGMMAVVTDERAAAYGRAGEPAAALAGNGSDAGQRDADQYGTDQYGTDQYGTGQYGPGSQYGAGTGQYAPGQYGAAGEYESAPQYADQQYGTQEYDQQRYDAGSQYGAPQYGQAQLYAVGSAQDSRSEPDAGQASDPGAGYQYPAVPGGPRYDGYAEPSLANGQPYGQEFGGQGQSDSIPGGASDAASA
ncbi:MAG TPA: hypothetical protein VGD91_19685, partial [Trebonia sp.]